MISTNGWTDELLFKTVLNHQMKGIIFHNDMWHYMNFVHSISIPINTK